MNQIETETAGKDTSRIRLRKLLLTALFSCMAYVLSTFVVFPNMAPFQHFVNVLAAVFVGPWYAFLAALITGGMRMLLGGRTILAITGAVCGAFLAGVCYKYTRKLWAAFLGEIIGTGIVSALISFPVMKYIFGLALDHFYYYIPFFMPASVVGGLMGLLVLASLKRSGLLKKWLGKLNER